MFHRPRQKAIQQAGMAIFPCAAGLCSFPLSTASFTRGNLSKLADIQLDIDVCFVCDDIIGIIDIDIRKRVTDAVSPHEKREASDRIAVCSWSCQCMEPGLVAGKHRRTV